MTVEPRSLSTRVGNAAFRALSNLALRAGRPVRTLLDGVAAWNLRRVNPNARYILCDLDAKDTTGRWQAQALPADRLTVVVVTYRQPQALLCTLASLSCQTCRNFDVIVLHDGPDAATRDAMDVFGGMDGELPIRYVETPTHHDDWGHSLRAIGIDMAAGDFVLLTNGDNYYAPRLVEYAFDAIERHRLDVVMWDMVHSHSRAGAMPVYAYAPFTVYPLRSRVDIGAFIVRTSLAKAAGFRDRSFDADASYFEDVVRAGRDAALRVGKINRTLMTHN